MDKCALDEYHNALGPLTVYGVRMAIPPCGVYVDDMAVWEYRYVVDEKMNPLAAVNAEKIGTPIDGDGVYWPYTNVPNEVVPQTMMLLKVLLAAALVLPSEKTLVTAVNTGVVPIPYPIGLYKAFEPDNTRYNGVP